MSCMKIGDVEVLSLKEAGERIGVSANTLLVQVRNGALVAQKIGKQWVVTVDDLNTYDARRKEPRGFAREDHPYHGRRGGGGRPPKAKSGDA